MKKNIFLIGALLVVAGTGWTLLKNESVPATDIDTNTPKYVTPVSAGPLKIGASATINGVTIRPLSVNDSRCPEGVQCIWAGTAVVSTRLSFGTLVQTLELELGKAATFAGRTVTLTALDPYPKSDKMLLPSDYTFSYSVN